MSHTSPRRAARRTMIGLQPKTERAVLSYAAAASVAGVGVLTLAQPSEAKVVYTPTHQILNASSILNIDINNDGITDFMLHNQRYSFSTGPLASYGALIVSGSVRVVGKQQHASAFPANVQIGPGNQFTVGSLVPELEFCSLQRTGTIVDKGYWTNAKNKYLALKFQLNGQSHFGWLRLSLEQTECKITAVLTGYAYETVVNKPIITGKTKGPEELTELIGPNSPAMAPSLGLLAQGANGLAIWRREEESTL